MASKSILTNISRMIVKSASVVKARDSSTRLLLQVTPSMMSANCYSLKRNINTQTWLLPERDYFIEYISEAEDMTTLHEEAMDRWRNEAAKFSELMVMDDILPNDGIDNSKVTEYFNYQLKSLIEELIEEDLLYPPVLWTAQDA